MDIGRAFGAGVAGGMIMGIIMMFTHSSGITPLDMPLYQGSLLTGVASAIAWWIGMVTHLIISGLIALVYAFGFEYFTNGASWVIGGVFGIAHWIIAGIALGVIGHIHPLMQEGVLEAPGFYAANFGIVSIAAGLLLHFIYGAVVGGIYSNGTTLYSD